MMFTFRLNTALASSIVLFAVSGASIQPTAAQDADTYKYCHNASDFEAVANSRRAEDLLDAADFDAEQAEMADRRATLAESMADGARRSAASDREAARVMSNPKYWNDGVQYWDQRAKDYDAEANRLREEANRLRRQVEAERSQASELRQAFNEHCKQTNNVFLQDSGELYELRQSVQREIKFIDRSNARRQARENNTPIKTSSVIDETMVPRLAIIVPPRRIDHVEIRVEPRRQVHRERSRLNRHHRRAQNKHQRQARQEWKKPRSKRIAKHSSRRHDNKVHRARKHTRLARQSERRTTRHLNPTRHLKKRHVARMGKASRRMGLGRSVRKHRRMGRIR